MAQRRPQHTKKHHILPISPLPSTSSATERRKYPARRSPNSSQRALGVHHTGGAGKGKEKVAARRWCTGGAGRRQPACRLGMSGDEGKALRPRAPLCVFLALHSVAGDGTLVDALSEDGEEEDYTAMCEQDRSIEMHIRHVYRPCSRHPCPAARRCSNASRRRLVH